MTNRMNTKVRLVKCPRCAKILPEPTQVPLYTCGECGTILQAKYYRSDNKPPVPLPSHETGVVQSNGIIDDHGDGESSGSIQSSSSADHSPDQNGGGIHQNVAENYDFDRIEDPNSAHHTSSSEKFSSLENKANGALENKIDQNSAHGASRESERLVTSNGEIEDYDDDGRDEKCHGVATENHDSSNIGSKRDESQVLENERDLQLALDRSFLEQNESHKLSMVNDAIEDGDYRDEKCDDIAFDKQRMVGDVNYVTEASRLNESDKNGVVHDGSDREILGEIREEHFQSKFSHGSDGKEDGTVNDQNDFVTHVGEQLESLNLSSKPSFSTEINHIRDDDSSPITEVNSEACKNQSVSASSSAVNGRINGKMSSNSKFSRDPQLEISSLDSVIETSGQNFDARAAYGSENVKSINKPESSLREVPRSPNKGSLAYEGSVSSFDGNDDQVPDQQQEVGKETLPGSPEWNTLPSGRTTYSSSGIESRAKSSSSALLDEKMKNGFLEEELLEEKEFPRKYITKENRHGFPPRVPFYQKSSEMTYESGSCSSYVHDELPSHRTRHHPYRYEDPDPWLGNTYTHGGDTNRRRFSEAAWREEFLPLIYNYETSGEIYHASRYHGNFDRRRRAESWTQSGNLPRGPYSGEVFNGRYQVRDPYMRRYPNDRRWSAQLPGPTAYCREGLCVGPSRDTGWDPYDSYLMSPPRFMDSESYGWAQDTVSLSDDQRHKDQVIRRLYANGREKLPPLRRHFRPMAGGAPFITCYFCFDILHFPEDFFVSQRRTHRLKCGACSRILEFSLESEGLLAPYAPNATEDTETNVGAGRGVNSASFSRPNHSHQSSSVTKEARDSSSGAVTREKNKLVSRNSRSEERSMVGSDDVAGPSVQGRHTKVTWHLPARSKSPLHRLMGYPSPHDLLDGLYVEDVE